MTPVSILKSSSVGRGINCRPAVDSGAKAFAREVVRRSAWRHRNGRVQYREDDRDHIVSCTRRKGVGRAARGLVLRERRSYFEAEEALRLQSFRYVRPTVLYLARCPLPAPTECAWFIHSPVFNQFRSGIDSTRTLSTSKDTGIMKTAEVKLQTPI
jgi:hypothetical protein